MANPDSDSTMRTLVATCDQLIAKLDGGTYTNDPLSIRSDLSYLRDLARGRQEVTIDLEDLEQVGKLTHLFGVALSKGTAGPVLIMQAALRDLSGTAGHESGTA